VNVTGTDLPDHYIGTAFNDTLGGGLGADLLLGEAGADSLSGGDGDDTLKPGAGDDTVNGGANSDTVDYSAATGAINVDLRLTTAQTIGGGMGIDTLSNLENIIGSALGDTLNGNESANRIEAGNGGDTVFGHGNNDVILGGTGPDTIDGGAGDDTVAGGIGKDVLAGGAGVDTVDYSGLNGAVTLNLSTATAQNTGLGTDTLSGFENAVGGIGNDKFTGTTAANRIQGAAGSDQINGLGGADLLEGGEGNDNLQGGNGSDTLVGGAGRDIMVGGNDADVFRFLAFADSAVGGQRDRVNDFVQGEDSVDLEAIDAIPFFGGDDDFAFIGDADFSNEAAQLRYFQLSGSNQTILEGDLNADGNADFQIAFVGLIDFAASDFLGVT
jgi:Ca2+-binding RTX toxin-like protein